MLEFFCLIMIKIFYFSAFMDYRAGNILFAVSGFCFIKGGFWVVYCII